MKLWRTPSTMDAISTPEQATRISKGKTTRYSGEKVQITLAHQVYENEGLLPPYTTMYKRDMLPPQNVFVDYMRSQIKPKKLCELTNIKLSTVEHWFRYDNSGFSYPSIEE